jgi:DNA-binding NtrC family response regulator
MKTVNKKILIVDEAGFCRICAAILEKEGYGTSAIHDIDQCESQLMNDDIGLVITSFPYGAHILEKLKKTKIPTIILSDHMSIDLLATLDNFDKSLSHCMIKPLDYHKFRTLVSQTMNRSMGQLGN